MRNVVGLVLVLGIAVAIFWFARARTAAPAQPAQAASGSAAAAPIPAAPPAKIGVRRLGKPERAALGAQIAAARERARGAAATSSSTTPPPALPDDTMRVEDVKAPLHTALRDTASLLANCYGLEVRGQTAAANMVLTSDPDLGTVIDTDAITDESGAPLAPELESCLRDTIDSVALPPLADKAGRLPLKYSFRFGS